METGKQPPGVDYPRTFDEMDEWFRTEAGCRAHIQRLRWPDEFTFRFNRRRSKARGLLFHRLAQQAVVVSPAPYSSIIHGKSL